MTPSFSNRAFETSEKSTEVKLPCEMTRRVLTAAENTVQHTINHSGMLIEEAVCRAFIYILESYASYE